MKTAWNRPHPLMILIVINVVALGWSLTIPREEAVYEERLRQFRRALIDNDMTALREIVADKLRIALSEEEFGQRPRRPIGFSVKPEELDKLPEIVPMVARYLRLRGHHILSADETEVVLRTNYSLRGSVSVPESHAEGLPIPARNGKVRVGRSFGTLETTWTKGARPKLLRAKLIPYPDGVRH